MTTEYFTPTSAVINNASRGIALAKRFNKNLEVLHKSVSRLPSVKIKKEMQLDEVKKLYQALSVLEPKVDLKKSVNGEPSPEAICWYSMGGSAGFAWSKIVLKSKGFSFDVSEKDTQVEDKSSWSKEPVFKAIDEELRQATFVVLEPDTVDAHGDIYDAAEVRKAKESFNKSCMNANLLHLVKTTTFEIIESYIAPADMVVGEQFVSKGSWLCTIQVHDDEIWNGIKDGTYNGVSVGCLANVTYLEEDEND